MQVDNYKTIEKLSEGIYREKGSKFIAYAYPVFSIDDIKEKLNEIKKEHPKSRHLCYAYRLGLDKNNYRANDDGEPSGSAGRPILGQIDSFELTNIFVGVIRYFGGTKLGIPGLIHAYKTSTIEALQQATIIHKTQKNTYALSFDYTKMSDIMNSLKKNNIEIVEQNFQETAEIKIAIPQSEVNLVLKNFKASFLKKSVDQISDIQEIEGLKLTFLSQ